MSKKFKIFIFSTPLVALCMVFSYSLFTKYQPKILKQIEEVRGLKTERSMMLPFPRGSEKVSYDKTSHSEQLTFKSKLLPEEIQIFYQNLLVEKQWVLDSEGKEEGFIVSKYKKDDMLTVITSTREDVQNITIASIEITKK